MTKEIVQACPKRPEITTCYLCGQPLSGPTSRDHVPPELLFPRDLRKTHSLTKLLTIKVHAACNEAYKLDEEYFAASLAPLAVGSVAGNAIFNRVVRRFHAGENCRLTNMVLEEFDRRPSGLILPKHLVAKRFQGERMQRVAWKIVRGLYFHHFGAAVSEKRHVSVTITPIGQPMPEHFEIFKASGEAAEGGAYPGIFAYQYARFDLLQYWALLLWDRLVLTVLFHDPACDCEGCVRFAA